MPAKTKTKKKETPKTKEEAIAIGPDAGDPGECGSLAIGSGPEEPPKKEEPKTIEIEDKDFHQFIKSTTKKAYNEINHHVRTMDADAIWNLNQKDIFSEIQMQANMGRNQAGIDGVIVPMGDTKICLRTEIAYRGVMQTLNELGFSANVRNNPTGGMYIAISW